MKKRFLGIACAALISGCSATELDIGSTTAGLTGQERNVLEVFDNHVANFRSGDLDAVMTDFGNNSIVMTADGVFEGKAQIRQLYAALLAEFGSIDNGDSPGITFDVKHVRGDMLFTEWHGESINLIFPYGTDTFIVKGKHIVRQSIAFAPPTVK